MTTTKPKTIRLYVCNQRVYIKKFSHMSDGQAVYTREPLLAGEVLPHWMDDEPRLQHFVKNGLVTGFDVPLPTTNKTTNKK